ncbi:anti-sigma factor family protein [Massilia horti]|uniref:Anti-sigma factor n=1 Tax=Massilia horti TaxID=2562153 RepID=A0A4Y9T861_9BURK|nr:anti-sigma factor [Massilia horti]TFW35768.1 anti-sigma factor [Massilia horti]
MECEQALALMQAYVDDELDAAQAATMSDHLRRCASCGAAFAELQALRAAIEWHGTRYRAPERLRERIRASLQDEQPKRRVLSSMPWAWINLGLASVASAGFAVVLALYLAGPTSADRLNEEIVSSHYRSLMSGHLADVGSSDQHTVKPWFGGKLDFSPPVYDLAQAGFVLVGGRVDYVAGRPVAALVYRHRKHVLSLYVWPAPGVADSDQHATSLQGFQLLSWTQRQMHFVAISDMSAQDISNFSETLRARFKQQ